MQGLKRRAALALPLGLFAPARSASAAGDRVFMDYDQAGLDDAYTQTKWAPDAARTIAGYASASEAARRAFPPRTERYGPGPAELVDIFAPADANALPVVAFIHGGAWRALSKDDASAAAAMFLPQGCLYVAVGFDNIPATTLPAMADQVARALHWLRANIVRFGGDAARLFVCGHSSGAHLAAVQLTRPGTAGLMRGGICLSGLYELHPALQSVRSAYVTLSGGETGLLSPLRHMGQLSCPVLVANGGRESPEFQRQAEVFSSVLVGMGRLESRVQMPALTHFEVPDQLNHADTPLSQEVLRMVHRS